VFKIVNLHNSDALIAVELDTRITCKHVAYNNRIFFVESISHRSYVRIRARGSNNEKMAEMKVYIIVILVYSFKHTFVVRGEWTTAIEVWGRK
jgi:hypothetical protein